MGSQQSTIDLLPDKIRVKLQDLLNDRRVTQLQAVDRINAILAELKAAGQLPEDAPEKVTKSSVNRYKKRMDEIGQKLRQGREVAEMFISKVGAAPQGQVGLLINEMLRAMAFELSLKIQDANLEDPEAMAATIDQVKALALAVQRLEQGATINVKREAEIRKQERERLQKKTMEVVESSGPMTSEQLKEKIREVYGV